MTGGTPAAAIDAASAPTAGSVVPLVVDVDGTLIKTDLLFECALQMVARRPLQLWRLLPWLAQGKAALKKHLVEVAELDTGHIPIREETVELIRRAQGLHRAVYLASASDRRLVESIAERIGGITGVFATDEGVNLSGSAKAKCLTAAFGERGFDYVGDAYVDFAVWRSARKVHALCHGRMFERLLFSRFPHAEIVARPRPRVRDYLGAARPHQWTKNALIFLPIVAGHFFDASNLLAALVAFLCFSLMASSAYLLNDLLDLPADREHPRKRTRPFAAGRIPLHHGMVLTAALAVAALAIAQTLPARFVLVLCTYFAVTLAYSFVLKRRIVVDVVTLGGLYTLRVLAGVTAIGAAYSPWLLVFCLFLFMALAVVKRCSELAAREGEGKLVVPGRGYRTEDLRTLIAFGAAAGYGAVLVIALYISSPEVRALYAHPNRLWLLCPILLYWVMRIFVIANRNELHDDPLVFALTDRVSWTCLAASVAVLMFAA